MKIQTFFLIYLCSAHAKNSNNAFSEELVIKEIGNNFVNTYFQFTTQWNYKNKNDRKIKKFQCPIYDFSNFH
jgi:hypothetical protein